MDSDRIREIGWIVSAQAGDREAFLRLVRCYERKVLFYVRRFERDPHRALDAMQEVWLTAWKSLGGLKKPEAFRGWLYRIAHGVAVSAIRAEQRRRELEQRQFRTTPSPRSERIPDDSAELIHDAIDRLSPEHREAITLRFLERMSINEIAEATGCPAGTVKSRLHYAIASIKRTIQEQTHDARP